MTKRYEVIIGTPDERSGETLTIQANSPEEARAQALENEALLNNPNWVVGEAKEIG